MTVLFVCTGNSCRSPMAAAYFDRLCRDRGLEATVLSAGTSAAYSVSAHAISVLARHDLKPLDMKCRQLDAALAEAADLIVTMTHAHSSWICHSFPAAADKTHPLSDFDHFHGDVPDPVGSDLETYQQVFEIMKPALERLADKLDRDSTEIQT